VHSYRALYYPFIHFKDDNWVKLSALYWDQFWRIVPERYPPDDSPTVRALGDFIQNARPDWVRGEFGDTFVEFIKGHGARLRDRFGLRLRHGWDPVPASELPPLAGGASGTDRRLGYVFFEKLSPALHDALTGSGLAEADGSDPRWIGMHPRLARVYMTALADQLAGERGLHPVADRTVDHLAVGGCTVARLAHVLLDEPGVEMERSPDEIETAAAFLAIQMAVPRNLDEVPVEKILEFREKHLDGRGAFQTYLSGFLEKRAWLATIEDREQLEASLRAEYQKELLPKLDDLRAKLADARFDLATSILSMQIAAPVALLAWALGPIAGIAGTAIGIAKVLRDRRKARREALRSSEVSFLLHTREQLAPEVVVGGITARARECFGPS